VSLAKQHASGKSKGICRTPEDVTAYNAAACAVRLHGAAHIDRRSQGLNRALAPPESYWDSYRVGKVVEGSDMAIRNPREMLFRVLNVGFEPRQVAAELAVEVNDLHQVGHTRAGYDACGLIGTTFRELDWKMRIFLERAVPISPNAWHVSRVQRISSQRLSSA
jgi:hypothetical protein